MVEILVDELEHPFDRPFDHVEEDLHPNHPFDLRVVAADREELLQDVEEDLRRPYEAIREEEVITFHSVP